MRYRAISGNRTKLLLSLVLLHHLLARVQGTWRFATRQTFDLVQEGDSSICGEASCSAGQGTLERAYYIRERFLALSMPEIRTRLRGAI